MRSYRAIVVPFCVVFWGLGACKGPEDNQRTARLDVPDQGLLAVQWRDGPRRQNAEVEVHRNARQIALRLFPDQPMGATSRGAGGAGAAEQVEESSRQDPAWIDGAPRPPEVAELDFPRAWPVEVRRGETPALLAGWAKVEVKGMLAENAEALKNRRWLKTGDRIQVVMSPNQKATFDRQRENFQRERIEAYFARRYFEKVIVYRVKRGEYVAQAAKRFGDVPLWLIEEFNQTDFRGLQPGDEILIPVVATLDPGREAPQGMLVVDEEGRPLAEERRKALEGRLTGDFAVNARMALDDSNVFMRPRSAATTPQPVGGLAAAGGEDFPRPTPAARIGGSGAAHALPSYGAVPRAEGGQEVGPPSEESERQRRDVVVKRGESLLHYVQWSQTPLEGIRNANPHLDPDRIFVGTRISIPMTDDQLTRFVVARAAWEAERDAPAPKAAVKASATKTYTVKKGDTATAIARRHGISLRALQASNPSIELAKLRAGQDLEVPAKR